MGVARELLDSLQIFQQLARISAWRKITGRDARIDLAHQLAVRMSPAHAARQYGGVDPRRLGEAGGLSQNHIGRTHDELRDRFGEGPRADRTNMGELPPNI